MKLKAKHLVFIAVFTVLVLISSHINFSPLLGADNQFFTLFQFFGPIAGGVLGPFIGGLSVLLAQLANFLAGREVTALNLLRLLPMVAAAVYFGTRKKKSTSLIALLAIGAFLVHPVGRQVWFYTLYWTIPLVAALFPKRLFLRSLGSTFTAHAVGGAIWIWTVPSTPELWLTLIPIVALERLLFASGISVSYVVANTLLEKVEHVTGYKAERPYVWERFKKSFLQYS